LDEGNSRNWTSLSIVGGSSRQLGVRCTPVFGQRSSVPDVEIQVGESSNEDGKAPAMNLWHLFLGFFIANALGYGGGPASIPLMQSQVVHHYHWLTDSQFANVLALGNALPGPISTNIASYVGFQVSGWLGVVIALIATILPSVVALLLLLKILGKYRQSSIVVGMTLSVQPVITVMMFLLTMEMGRNAVNQIGIGQSVIIGAVAFIAMKMGKIHPAIVIVLAFVYGGLVMPRI